MKSIFNFDSISSPYICASMSLVQLCTYVGCRDVTKVPASIDGVLDFHFYDYFFQREVPLEGYTDPTITKWIRNEREQPKEDFPSPKNRRLISLSRLHNPEVLVLVGIIMKAKGNR
jgi:hypothetical protein